MINTAKSAYAYYGANIRDAPSDRDVRGKVKGVQPLLWLRGRADEDSG